MSYSITVPFKSKNDRDTMIAFVNRPQFSQEFAQLQAKLSPWGSSPRLVEGEQLGYLPNVDPRVLAGFQATEITRLNWAVCVWAAVKFGKPDKNGPHIYYDNEKMPIDMSKTHPTNVWANEQGVMEFDREKGVLLRLFQPVSNKRIQQFIEKINSVWDQENTPSIKGPKL